MRTTLSIVIILFKNHFPLERPVLFCNVGVLRFDALNTIPAIRKQLVEPTSELPSRSLSIMLIL